jgi:hypothetical protein
MNTGRKAVSENWQLSQIKNLVIVKADPIEFKVTVDRDRGTTTGAALFGLVGAALENSRCSRRS